MLNIFINLLLVVHILVCLLIVLAVLMQRPKNEGLGAAFGGGMTDSLFGAQTTNVLATITRWLGGLFFVLTLVLSALYARQGREKTGVEQRLQQSAKPVEPPSATTLPSGISTEVAPDAQKGAAEAPKPSGEAPKPAAEAPKPAGEAPKPAGEAPKPAGEAPKPAGEAPKPAGEAPKPAGEAPKPAGEAPKPAGEAPKPAGEAPKPAGEAPKSSSSSDLLRAEPILKLASIPQPNVAPASAQPEIVGQ
jgi:protein translocase SecG subunit